MKIEEQVLSIEQMKHLREVGLKVEDTALCWADLSEPGKFSVSPNYENAHEILREGCVIIPTLTLQEILELLPEHIVVELKIPSVFKFKITKNCMTYVNSFNLVVHHEVYKSSSLKCAYQMLCWVLENGYLKS